MTTVDKEFVFRAAKSNGQYYNCPEQRGLDLATTAGLGWRDRERAMQLLDQLQVGDTIADDENDIWERVS